MRADRLRSVRATAVLAVTALLGLLTFGPAQAAQATTYVPLTGDGSTYAYPALNQWATDLAPAGERITYTPNGSATGRQHYLGNVVDFAGSDIAFITSANPDPFGGVDTPYTINTAYSYIPDVGGGLSFLYNLQVGGHRITNLRLSGKTLAEIFTGHIKNWDDPAITHDYGAPLPNIPITVVTRSDGAGESYFLSRWLDKEYPSLWIPFCQAGGGPPGCGTGPTELYPGQSAGFKSLSGSDSLAAYIASSSNNGAIGYAEYAYAKENSIPVVNMLNAAGYYVPPSASNVAVALHAAVIDENPSHVTYLMQNLDGVYNDPDPRTYPLSAYSYLIVPRDSRTIGGHTYHQPSGFTNSKGVALSTYVNYILCNAQQSAVALGYSPLPKPMVTGGFLQDSHIPGAVPNPAAGNYDSCNNPAYSHGQDVLLAQAPMPSPCQKVTAPLNCGSNNPGSNTPGSNNPGSNNPGSNNPGSNTPGSNNPGSNNPGSNTPGSNTPGSNNRSNTPGSSTGPGSTPSINPNTGQVVSGSQPGAGGTNVSAQQVSLASRPATQWLLGTLTAIELLAALVVPVALGTWLQRRRNPRQGTLR
jgi:ABC-type phosphate transport system substrate-binding protein